MTGNVYSTKQPGTKVGTALLTVQGKRLAGRITSLDEVYEIRPLTNGLHVVIRSDPKKRLPMHPVRRDGGGTPLPPAPPPPPKPVLGPHAPPARFVRVSGRPPAPAPAPVPAATPASAPSPAPAPATVPPPVPAPSAASAPPPAAGQGGPDTPQAPALNACTPPLLPTNAPIPTVRVSVVFEEDALPETTDLELLGNSYVSTTNAAMAISRVAAQVTTASVRTITPFVTNGGLGVLDQIAATDSLTPDPIGKLHRERVLDKADIVVIVSKAAIFCGLSFQHRADPRFAFALVHPACTAAELQVAHEIGHILGADHEEGQASPLESKAFARAFKMLSLGKGTIMYFQTSGVVAEPYYSNPFVCWDSQLLQQTGEVDKAENAKAIGLGASAVANSFP